MTNKMSKRLLGAVLMTVMLICIALAAVSCTTPTGDPVGEATVVVADKENVVSYTVPLSEIEDSGSGALALLEYLRDEEGLTVESTVGPYGVQLTRVGDIVNGEGGEYIYLYTSVEKDFDVSEYASSVEYGGKTLGNSGVGISEMSYEDGCVIFVGIYGYEY